MDSLDYDRHICAECGRQLQNHALEIRGDGVVVAGAYTDSNTFTICADRREQRRQDRIAELERRR